MELAIILTLLVVLAVAAVRWGADSRTSERPFPVRASPARSDEPPPEAPAAALARPAPAET